MRRAVDRFIRTRPNLASPEGALSQCRIATQDLVDALKAEGVSAAAVWVRGHRREPDDLSPLAMAADRHMLVRLPDGSFADVTRRQFAVEAPHPRYYTSESELAFDWQEIDDGPIDGRLDDEKWRRLA